MDFSLKTKELSRLINQSLNPLITGDYVLWGLPNYRNEGDVLVWQGTLEYLKSVPFKCLGTRRFDEYIYIPLKKETIILILGGGYFGDTWRPAWKNVVSSLVLYPDNPIILLPQSIHYESAVLLSKDRDKLSQCKHLTICARDIDSFDFAKDNFPSHQVLLVPDMAFHITSLKSKNNPRKGILYIKRTDKEFVPIQDQKLLNTADAVSDWPSVHWYPALFFSLGIYSILRRLWRIPVIHHLCEGWLKCTYRPLMIHNAVRFLSPYTVIITTRLHAAILSLMMGKRVYCLDNSYGKLSALYRTWFQDCDALSMIKDSDLVDE